MRILKLLLPFLLVSAFAQAQPVGTKYQPITGNYDNKGWYKFSQYKNNNTRDSVLVTDSLGRVHQKYFTTGGSGTINTGNQYRLPYYTATGIVLGPASAITNGRALISDANGLPAHSVITSIELGYLAGASSAIQTQINGKAPTASPALTGAPTTPDQAAKDSSTRIANTKYVDRAAKQATIDNATTLLSHTGSIVKDVSVTGDTIYLDANVERNVYGKTYSEKVGGFNLGTDFNANGITATDSAGHIVLSGANNTLNRSLDLKIDKVNGGNGYFNYDRWGFGIGFKIINTGIVWFGLRSGTINTPGSGAFAYINTSTGVCQFEGATVTLAMSPGDSVVAYAERDVWNTYLQVRNVTTNSAPVSTTGNYSLSNGVVPVMGRFAVGLYTTGAKIYLDSVSTKINVPRHGLIFIGDSKTRGYNGTNLVNFTELLSNRFPNVINCGGGYETTADWELEMEAIINDEPYGIVLGGTSNDLRTAIHTDSTKARYNRMENRARAHGIPVWHLDGMYETNTDPVVWMQYIHATKSPDSTFFTYFPTKVPGALASDGIHPTDTGHKIIACEIWNENKITTTYDPNLSPKNSIKNQTAVTQDAGFNVRKNCYTFGHFRLGSGITGEIQLVIQNSPGYYTQFSEFGGTTSIAFADSVGTTFNPGKIQGSTLDFYNNAIKAIGTTGGNVEVYGKLRFGVGADFSGVYPLEGQLGDDNWFRGYHFGSWNHFDFAGFNPAFHRNFSIDAADLRLNSNGVDAIAISGASVGIGTTSNAASAITEIASTTKGFLPPRMTTTQKNAISSPAEGLVVYDLTLHKLCVYTGSAWETITSL